MYQERILSCTEPGCSNIFSPPLTQTSLNLPSQSKETPNYVHYQINPKLDPHSSYLQVSVPKIPPNKDYCLKFTYQSTESKLLVSLDLKSDYTIEFPIESNQNGQQVCTSWLTYDVERVTDFYFRYEKIPINDFDHHGVKLLGEVAVLFEEQNWNRIEGTANGKAWKDNFLGKVEENFDLAKSGEIIFKVRTIFYIKIL